MWPTHIWASQPPLSTDFQTRGQPTATTTIGWLRPLPTYYCHIGLLEELCTQLAVSEDLSISGGDEELASSNSNDPVNRETWWAYTCRSIDYVDENHTATGTDWVLGHFILLFTEIYCLTGLHHTRKKETIYLHLSGELSYATTDCVLGSVEAL